MSRRPSRRPPASARARVAERPARRSAERPARARRGRARRTPLRVARALTGLGRRGRRLLILLLLGALFAYPGAFLADALLQLIFG
ncbi:hypothetical protein [Elioraea thermophila]|uniref:hypothetical protein n=1 Tax=Elioraea thermophila TaxID=2185104 RepID=UPI0013008661|nr:hypothetical protein [Elioraea thermophila]